MSSFGGLSNPILYAQFHSRGGWGRLVLTVGGYVLLVGALIAISTYETHPSQRDDTLSRSLNVLLGLQVLTVTFFGTTRISSAVRADFKDHMIESHRLMPMPRFTAVFGYVLGPAAHAIALGAATVVMGLIICPLSHTVDPQRWLTANFMLGCFTLMLWAISAQIAFSVRGGVLILVIAAFLLMANAGSAFTMLPGLALITYPIVGHSLFDLDTSFTDVQSAYGLSLVVQGAITVVCLAATARKYRSRDGVGLNAPLGLLLLLIGVGASVVAILQEDMFRWGYRGNDDARTRFAGTAATALLLALVPLSSIARNSASRDRTNRSDKASTIGVALVAVGIVSLLLLAMPLVSPVVWRNPAGVSTFIVLAVAIFSFAALFRWAYSLTSKIWWIGAIWLALVWLAPLALQAAHDGRADAQTAPAWYYTASPIGALVGLWTHDPSLIRGGILFQAGLMLVPMSLAAAALWQRSHQKSPADEIEDLVAGPLSTE